MAAIYPALNPLSILGHFSPPAGAAVQHRKEGGQGVVRWAPSLVGGYGDDGLVHWPPKTLGECPSMPRRR